MVERFITIYRPTYLAGMQDGWPVYRMGDLRAKIFGFLRVPALWALSRVKAGRQTW